VEIDSPKRPDIAIFKAASAFVDAGPPSPPSYDRIQPAGRDDYTADENPTPALRIRACNKSGEPRRSPRPADLGCLPYALYGYIVPRQHRRLTTQADNAQLTRTPDSNGFFGYNPHLGSTWRKISFR
jgi:hypothetical protein